MRKLISTYEQGWNDAIEAVYDMIDYGLCEDCEYGEECSLNHTRWLRWCNEENHYIDLIKEAVKGMRK